VPVLRVCIVGQRDIAPDVAQRLADGAGQILNAPAGATWVTIDGLPASRYAENGVVDPPQPVFIHLLLKHGVAQLQSGQIQSLCALAQAVLGVPEQNVHVVVDPAAAGRVHFGGAASQ
jgi:phenylpyruvate tautomerase PptA (4-oxalocrotonate tautomerase family)